MISIMIVCILIISVCIHEWAHGYVAYLLGDKTAYYLKRLTLNPFRHIDLVGSIVVPFLLVVTGTQFVFGWAKPVPVNVAYFKRPKRDMLMVAMAGPVVNLLLAIMAVIILKWIFYSSFFIKSNISFLFFNIFPFFCVVILLKVSFINFPYTKTLLILDLLISFATSL